VRQLSRYWLADTGGIRWVTRHIDYDVSGFLSGNYGDFTPEGVLRRRVSVCGLLKYIGR
jgi:hypothetical protein